MTITISKKITELIKNINEIETFALQILSQGKIERLLTPLNRWYPLDNDQGKENQKETITKYEIWFSESSSIIQEFSPERYIEFKGIYHNIITHLMLQSKPETLNLDEPIQDLRVNLHRQKGMLESILTVIKTRELFPKQVVFDPFKILSKIFSNFHKMARQLRTRRKEKNVTRPTLEVKDEYDVQDLLHGILKLFFDDIRPEEWTPSYAGGAVRMDFLLKKEKIVIEVKKTRNSMTQKELGEQLIIDIIKYQIHPDCKILICFVYDPEGFIGNPKGIENDLSRKSESIEVFVYIKPEF
jgi:DpnII restriction endonuclease